MTYKGNNFKKILSAILADRHSQPVSIASYMHMQNNTVAVEYTYRERGKTKGSSTKIELTQLLEFQMNYTF